MHRSIWISGLSAAGKSTLARLLVARLRAFGYPTALLDGDEMRQVFDVKLGYDLASRRKQTERIRRLAQWVGRQGIVSVVAIVHPCDADRQACRQQVDGYFEVHLECPLAVCIGRDPKHLYEEALSGRREHVVGVDIPYDTPGFVDLRLRSDAHSPEELLAEVWKRLSPILGEPAAVASHATVEKA